MNDKYIIYNIIIKIIIQKMNKVRFNEFKNI